MRKGDIVRGERYACTAGKELFHGWYPVKQAVVVDEGTWSKNRYAPLHVGREDPKYVAAHLAWALTEAYPEDSTPREKAAAKQLVRIELENAKHRWFEADVHRLEEDGARVRVERPMRAFHTHEKTPSFGESGVLGRYIATNRDTGAETIGELVVIPRREVRMLWSEYLAAKKQQMVRGR